MSTTAIYTLGTNAAEQARLRQQAEDLQPYSRAILDHVGLQPGSVAIDLGCGPRGILELLSERVGPNGRVVGVDMNPEHVALACALIKEQGLANVDVLERDARHTGLPSASFDLIHARTLLINIPAPEEVVAVLTAAIFVDGLAGLRGDGLAGVIDHAVYGGSHSAPSTAG